MGVVEDLAIAVSWAQLMTTISMVLFITTAVFGGLMAALVKFTPAPAFLKAKLKGQNIVAAFRRDRRVDFVPAKYSSGIEETKQYGDYITDPESVYTCKKSGVGVCVVSTELGVTISPQIAKIIRGLQEMKIPNIRIAKMINSTLHHCNDCNEQMLADFKQQKSNDGKVVEWFECSKCHGKNVTKVDLGAESLEIEALKFENLSKWSETIMNPVLQATNKEYKVQEAIIDLQKPKLGLMMTLIGVGIMIFMILLGVMILLPHIGGGGAAAAQGATNIVTQTLNQTTGGIMKA